jgi:hypothetical protein
LVCILESFSGSYQSSSCQHALSNFSYTVVPITGNTNVVPHILFIYGSYNHCLSATDRLSFFDVLAPVLGYSSAFFIVWPIGIQFQGLSKVNKHISMEGRFFEWIKVTLPMSHFIIWVSN